VTRQLSIPLLLVALLLAWALFGPSDRLLQPPPVEEKTTELIPDSYARDVIALEFNTDGSLASETRASTLERFAAAGRVELIEPQRREFSGTDEWYARARRGTLFERRESLRLWGEARLDYLSGSAELRTERLLIDLRNKRAFSQAPVTVTQADGHRIEAKQLVADLAGQRAIFSDSVKSVYVPNR